MLCSEHFREWERWLDYRPPAPIKIVQIGRPEHNVPWGQRVNETIKSQQQLIVDSCKRNHPENWK